MTGQQVPPGQITSLRLTRREVSTISTAAASARVPLPGPAGREQSDMYDVGWSATQA